MRCCAHILNLIVKDGLEPLKKTIDNIRESVAYWTATPKRIEKFEDIVLGRRQSRHPSLEVFAAAAGLTETKRAGTLFA
jgi:plasmid stabilization system protein ParE